ncbi:cell division protein FtsL [Syntrophus gentianae]|uniref:Cell division protein FtsL n=1 Tax=Syntrophus gentianae TaxID=43775 RepID=A0A1H7X4Q6_9BACT|nr:cell division protein FtsL [Syntrophus gentianae]SEM28850.1 cell division protein FtsL [Syntrophus gentianae]
MPIDETQDMSLPPELPEEEKSKGVKYAPLIIAAFVLMGVALIYVWSHLRMTGLEYKIAEEMTRREQLLEEQRQLKVEIATLKAPNRIETIVKEKLQMIYPQREQIIHLGESVKKR